MLISLSSIVALNPDKFNFMGMKILKNLVFMILIRDNRHSAKLRLICLEYTKFGITYNVQKLFNFWILETKRQRAKMKLKSQ